MKKWILSLCLLATMAMTVQAQIKTPAASPSSTLTQEVGLATVTVEYSRPSMKGRTIFAADGLVPHGQLWRTGANSATKLTFSEDVKVGGKDIEKGSYAMLTTPTAGDWTVHLYKHEGGSWSAYKEKTAVASFSATPEKLPFSIESFTITIDDLTDKGANLSMMWDNVMVNMPIAVEVDSKVEDMITSTMAGPKRGDYYSAATYYYNNGKDMNKALTWIQKANAMDAKFWQLRRESQILAELGRYKEAVAAAEKSMAAAQEAGNMEYVKFNKDAIAEWAKMKGKKSMKKSK